MKQLSINTKLTHSLLILIGLFAYSNLFAQSPKEVALRAPISEVTVYLKGAQVTRDANTSVSEGKSLLKITNLSPYVDSKSVQVRINNANITVLSVNYQLNFLDSLKKSKELNALSQQLESTEDKLLAEKTKLEVINDELNFLKIGLKLFDYHVSNTVILSSLRQCFIVKEKFLNRFTATQQELVEIDRYTTQYFIFLIMIFLKSPVSTLNKFYILLRLSPLIIGSVTNKNIIRWILKNI